MSHENRLEMKADYPSADSASLTSQNQVLILELTRQLEQSPNRGELFVQRAKSSTPRL